MSKLLLRCLTWNISGLDISSRSVFSSQTAHPRLPGGSTAASDADSKIQLTPMEKKYRDIVSVITAENIDLLFIQEGTDEFAATLESLTAFQLIGSKPSHMGLVQTFIRDPVRAESAVLVEDAPGPVVVVQLPEITLVNCHLAPLKTGGEARVGQVKSVLHRVHAPPQPILVAGDLNLRNPEAPRISKLGLVELKPSNSEKSFSWDSEENLYHSDGFGFRCNFDRVFYKNLQARNYAIVKGAVDASVSHYLSDHYAIRFDIDL